VGLPEAADHGGGCRLNRSPVPWRRVAERRRGTRDAGARGRKGEGARGPIRRSGSGGRESRKKDRARG
jgi:hypothetical protein